MRALVILPSYNTGRLLAPVVEEVLHHWNPVWVVIDGSTDRSDVELEDRLGGADGLRILRMPVNRGKGAAFMHACRIAMNEGFTHALCMDSDGQHPAHEIGRFMKIAEANPSALVLGVPDFGPDAPPERVKGRRVGNTFANIETLWSGLEDSLFGFRVYPITPLLKVMRRTPGGKRYDFDTEAAVRLVWAGIRPLPLRTPVRYPSPGEGGVSHFKYLRDNVLLTGMHTRLLIELIVRLPFVIRNRRKWKRSAIAEHPPTKKTNQ